MNILLTAVCNLRCPHCFAEPAMSGTPAARQFMPLADLDRALDFLRRSGGDEVKILGGEPTLHPEFETAIDHALARGFKVQLFTNGLMPERALRYLRRQRGGRVRLLLNLNPPAFYFADQKARLDRVLRDLRDRTMLGVTVSGPGQKLGYLLRSVVSYRLQPVVRIGIAAPAPGLRNRYARLKDHREITSDIVAFVRACDRRDVSVTFDCGFRLCSFTERQLGSLQRCNSPVRAECAPAFDVAPDLTVTRCFATAGTYAANLKEFRDLAALTAHFEKRFGMLSAMSAGKKCAACRHFKRGQCRGGCLGYRLSPFRNGRTG